MRSSSIARRLAVLAGGFALCVSATSALAQDADPPPFDAAIGVQLFEYPTGPHSFLTVPDSDVIGHNQFSLDFFVTFITDPLTVYEVNEDNNEIERERTAVVESVFAGELGGAYGLLDKFELGVSLPIIFSMAGDGLDPSTATPSMEGIQVTGLGDLRLEAKWRAWKQENMRLAIIPGVSLPTSFGSGGGDFLGDDLPTLRGRVAFQWTDQGGNLTIGANAGLIFRKPRTIYSSEVGQQVHYGLGANFRVASSVDAVAELFGRTGLTTVDLDASPLEALGGVRVQATRSFSVLAGGGAGLVKGIGSPGLRVFASVGWSPDFRDQDGDGVANNNDRCPLLAEDRDGFEDDDGCPDMDNDGDKREDGDDKCPNEAEDLDGFQDDDGCPEADNDNDGFLDADDRCPTYPEDGKAPYADDGCPADKRDSDDDGTFDAMDKCPDDPEDLDEFEDWDGCPDVDNDADDIPDDYDNCPLCKEDTDGFADDDGCPELDNDADGFADGEDKCPDEAEVLNGVDDFDGCPDEGGVELARLDGDRVLLEGDVEFSKRDRLTARGEVFVDQIAVLMRMHPEVSRWRIVVAAPRKGSDEATRQSSQARAEAIRDRLASRGVPADNLEALGAVSDNTVVAIVVTERAAGGDGPVCPAGMEVTPRDKPAAPAPAPAVPATPAPDRDVKPEPVSKPAPPPAEEPAADLVPAELTKYAGVVGGIEFKRGSPVLTRKSFKTLDAIAALLAKYPFVTVEIVCHTDDKKPEDESSALTQAQADVIAAYLMDKGVAPERITAVGRGSSEPIANNKSSKGRAENRRVELTFGVTK